MFDLVYWVAVVVYFLVVLFLATLLEDNRRTHKTRQGLFNIYIIGGLPALPLLGRRRKVKPRL